MTSSAENLQPTYKAYDDVISQHIAATILAQNRGTMDVAIRKVRSKWPWCCWNTAGRSTLTAMWYHQTAWDAPSLLLSCLPRIVQLFTLILLQSFGTHQPVANTLPCKSLPQCSQVTHPIPEQKPGSSNVVMKIWSHSGHYHVSLLCKRPSRQSQATKSLTLL